jgi:uncharacterized protein (DUF2236 family)
MKLTDSQAKKIYNEAKRALARTQFNNALLPADLEEFRQMLEIILRK